MNHRISWKYDTDTDGDVDANDKIYHFAYDERWRIVAVYREDDTTPKEIFGYHNAGADGTGGSSYIDQTLLREKDANAAWTSASDGTLEQRHYYLQNWRADVIGTVSTSGAQVENQRYFSYGIPFGMYAGDVNGDGLTDSTDQSQMSTWISAGTYDARGDLDRDGDLDATDSGTVTSNVGTNLGFGKLSTTAVHNRKGYAGYEADPVAAGNLYHVRHRVLSGELGRWGSKFGDYNKVHNTYAFANPNIGALMRQAGQPPAPGEGTPIPDDIYFVCPNGSGTQCINCSPDATLTCELSISTEVCLEVQGVSICVDETHTYTSEVPPCSAAQLCAKFTCRWKTCWKWNPDWLFTLPFWGGSGWWVEYPCYQCSFSGVILQPMPLPASCTSCDQGPRVTALPTQ